MGFRRSIHSSRFKVLAVPAPPARGLRRSLERADKVSTLLTAYAVRIYVPALLARCSRLSPLALTCRQRRHAALGGLTPPHFLSLGVRTPHWSREGVSFLFQSRRSPAPGLRPATCPDGGGTFLVGHGNRTPSASYHYALQHTKTWRTQPEQPRSLPGKLSPKRTCGTVGTIPK